MTQKVKFDPNGPSDFADGLFGLPYKEDESRIVIIPVPWEATTSYGGGTSRGPQAILDASQQVDLFDLELGRFYEAGIHMQKIPKKIHKLSVEAKRAAKKHLTKKVNAASQVVNKHVYQTTKRLLDSGKIVGLLGGDHSSPFGCIQAHLEKYPDMGILHFDAHADLREAYEGFTDSHASIFNNVIKKTSLKKLVQVGVRDFCEQEVTFAKEHEDRVKIFFDEHLAREKHAGRNWSSICEEIVGELPKQVYISFDIDGLDPKLCPNTGTPVPGGLEFQEALTLIKMLTKTGRQIVGFDLNEVAPGPDQKSSNAEFDANVGARMLFKLCGWTLASRGLA